MQDEFDSYSVFDDDMFHKLEDENIDENDEEIEENIEEENIEEDIVEEHIQEEPMEEVQIEEENIEEENIEEFNNVTSSFDNINNDESSTNFLDEQNNDENIYYATIKVIGVGGAGCNALNKMYQEINSDNIELWIANTDNQVLVQSPIQNRISLGVEVTKGLGAGANPEIGRKAALASRKQIENALFDANMVFIAAGMGGGTGTGAAPVIAEICQQKGILTVGIVTRPFTFEGKTRNKNAVSGLQELRPYCDSLIVISNDQLLNLFGNKPLNQSFTEIDNILCHSVKTLSDLITKPSLINLDFADVTTVMKGKGTALIGMGIGEGEDKARDAATGAVNSVLLEASIKGAKNAIVNIIGGPTMTINDAQDAVEYIRSAASDSDINIIFGVDIKEEYGDKMEVTVIATEFEGNDLHNIENKEEFKNIKDIAHINVEDFKEVEPVEIKKEEAVFEEIKEEVKEEKKSLFDKKSFIPSFLRKRN